MPRFAAASAYGPRVIGVVLTGNSDCGTAGLLSITARGGLAIVQDPRDAAIADMPNSAIRHAPVNHIVPLADIAPLLVRLTRDHASAPHPERGAADPQPVDRNLLELEGTEPGVASDLVCPACHGKLTETELNRYVSYRCHEGHVFSMDSIAAEQTEEVERALWAAARALDESAALARRLADRSDGDMRQRFEERAQVQTDQARTIRDIVIRGTSSLAAAGE